MLDKRYLVKWCGLEYSDNTWERRGRITDELLQQYNKFNRAPSNEEVTEYRQSANRSRGQFVPFTDCAGAQPLPVNCFVMVKPCNAHSCNAFVWYCACWYVQSFGASLSVRNYQLEGINWLAFHYHCGQSSILAGIRVIPLFVETISSLTLRVRLLYHSLRSDEMGLGHNSATYTYDLLSFVVLSSSKPSAFLFCRQDRSKLGVSSVSSWQSEYSRSFLSGSTIVYGSALAARGAEILSSYECSDISWFSRVSRSDQSIWILLIRRQKIFLNVPC